MRSPRYAVSSADRTGEFPTQPIGSICAVARDGPSSRDPARRRARETIGTSPRPTCGVENGNATRDAQDLNIPSSSVDVVICRWGFMLMEDPPRPFDRPRECCVPVAGSHSQSGVILAGTHGRRSTQKSSLTSGLRRWLRRLMQAGCSHWPIWIG